MESAAVRDITEASVYAQEKGKDERNILLDVYVYVWSISAVSGEFDITVLCLSS